MVKLFGRGKDKNREAFVQQVTATQVAARGQARAIQSQTQQLNSLGKAYYLQQDENVQDLLVKYCPQLGPAFSRLNATSQIKKQKDRQLMQWLFKDLLLHMEMEIHEDSAEADAMARSLVKSLRINAEFRILDAWEGYRGKLVVEEVEKTTVTVEEPKKKGFL